MTMSLGLLAIALLGADGPMPAVPDLAGIGPVPPPYAPSPTGPTISYEIRFLSVRGLGWRTAMRDKLKDVAQHEGATVWTLDDEGTEALLERVQADAGSNVVQAPRVTVNAEASAT
ncbi:MAG TPA: hypothetical protein VG406_08240, partial [Isosphaeraceae bacterium]|nr:hypothetical protein [Isosphaeraceae bacterium]